MDSKIKKWIEARFAPDSPARTYPTVPQKEAYALSESGLDSIEYTEEVIEAITQFLSENYTLKNEFVISIDLHISKLLEMIREPVVKDMDEDKYQRALKLKTENAIQAGELIAVRDKVLRDIADQDAAALDRLSKRRRREISPEKVHMNGKNGRG